MVSISLDLTLRDIPNSTAVEEKIRKKVDKLSQFYTHIEFCKVVVEAPQKHQHQGKLYSVLIELAVPGKKLVVNHKEGEDLYVVIRDAFSAMKRQVEAYARVQRGDVKTHMLGSEEWQEEGRM